MKKKQKLTLEQIKNDVEYYESALDCMIRKYELAKESRRFWRREAKRLGTPYNYHKQYARGTVVVGDKGKVVKRPKLRS